MNEITIKRPKMFLIIAGIVVIAIIAAMFFAGRASRGSGMETEISDVIDDVKRIAAEMDASVDILNGAADNLEAAGSKLEGIAADVEQFTNSISGRIDGLATVVNSGIDGLDKSIKRSIEISQGYQEQLDAAIGAASGMDDYIKQITGYIKSVDEGTAEGDF